MQQRKKNQGELILDHYEKFLGNFYDRDIFKSHTSAATVQFLKYQNIFEGCITYATMGVSNYASQIKNHCEIVMISDDSFEECEELFANAIFYIIDNKMEFGRGIFIEGIENISKKFFEKHEKNALYFTETYVFPEEFTNFAVNHKMYMAFFISQEECNYIKKYGAEKFEECLEKFECDVLDINRASIV